MAQWQALGPEDMLSEGAMQRIDLDATAILLCKVRGVYYATQEHCPHLRVHLANGKLNGQVVTCPGHGSQFDVTTGACVAWVEGLPGIVRQAALAVAKPRDLTTYPTRLQDGQVWVLA